MGVIFNGGSRVVQLTPGTTDIDVKKDIYTPWKEWVVQGDNAKYLPAISCIGGDPISDVLRLGSTFFLENGWKIRPQEANHALRVTGNLYTRDGLSPFLSTVGTYNVVIDMARSNLIDTVATGGGSGSVDLTPVTKKLSDLEALVASAL